MKNDSEPLSIVIVGASGDLATRKVLPALFALYCQGFLPDGFQIFGFARTPLTHADFQSRVREHLTCRYVPGAACGDKMDAFLARCWYQSGEYGARESFMDFFQLMQEVEGTGAPRNRLFYLAIPPSLFGEVAGAIAGAGLVQCGSRDPWSRVVVEKPFGRDRESSDRLTRDMARIFSEDQTYRIDHYLGKEAIQNLMVLRFANLVFEPLWNGACIQDVRIRWKEAVGVGARGGYFDHYGIIRDVVQNHLLQILALIAMERPLSVDAKDVRDEKVKVLRRIRPLALKDVVIGQYRSGALKGVAHPGYTEEPSVSPNSDTPTFAQVVLEIENERWRKVPFIITAGKGLSEQINEVRIRFRPVPDNIFCPPGSRECLPPNEFVIRIQPDEALYLEIVNKQPGLDVALTKSALNLRYQSAFSTPIPDAYECLLLDVMQGDKSLFIRSDELEAAWDVFTPVLREIEKNRIEPLPYAFGTDGPIEQQASEQRRVKPQIAES